MWPNEEFSVLSLTSAGQVLNTEMTTIYIRLLDEGTEAFRPTSAEPVGNALFRVLPTSNYDSGDEKWEFVPGSLVGCQKRKLEGEDVLVAVRSDPRHEALQTEH
jgi:hypothetical protein